MPKKVASTYDDIRLGRGTPQTDPDTGTQKIFEGRKPHERQWAGSKEWQVPGAKDPGNTRILERPDGRMGWTVDHYVTIHKFGAPHFPDFGW